MLLTFLYKTTYPQEKDKHVDNTKGRNPYCIKVSACV